MKLNDWGGASDQAQDAALQLPKAQLRKITLLVFLLSFGCEISHATEFAEPSQTLHCLHSERIILKQFLTVPSLFLIFDKPLSQAKEPGVDSAQVPQESEDAYFWSLGEKIAQAQARGDVARVISRDLDGGDFFGLYEPKIFSQFLRDGIEKQPEYLLQVFRPIEKEVPPHDPNLKLRRFVAQKDQDIKTITKLLRCFTETTTEKERSVWRKAQFGLTVQSLQIIDDEIKFIIELIQKRLVLKSNNEEASPSQKEGPYQVIETPLQPYQPTLPMAPAANAVIQHSPIFQHEWMNAAQKITSFENRYRKEIGFLKQDLKERFILMSQLIKDTEASRYYLESIRPMDDSQTDSNAEERLKKPKSLSKTQQVTIADSIAELKISLNKSASWACHTQIYSDNTSQISESIIPAHQLAEADIDCSDR